MRPIVASRSRVQKSILSILSQARGFTNRYLIGEEAFWRAVCTQELVLSGVLAFLVVIAVQLVNRLHMLRIILLYVCKFSLNLSVYGSAKHRR